MSVIYHLCAYDRATDRLVAEHAVPENLLPMVRTLIKPAPEDSDLVLSYELTTGAAQSLSNATGLPIEPAPCHYYFEASDAADAVIGNEVAAAAR
jgi:hypothetical protein